MDTTIENLKREISVYYIKDFKKELGWLKSIAILPIQKPIKDIIIGKSSLPEKFDEIDEFGWRKDVINFISPQFSNEIFEFMKDKRLEIEKRKTEIELIALKNEILGLEVHSNPVESETQIELENQTEEKADKQTEIIDLKNGDENEEIFDNTKAELIKPEESKDTGGVNPAVAGIETAVVGGTGVKILEKTVAKNVVEQLDAETMKSTIEGVIDYTEKKKKSIGHRLTTKESETVDKYINNLKKGMEEIDDEAVEAINARNNLGNELKLPRELLEKCGLKPNQLDIIGNNAIELSQIEKIEDFKETLKYKYKITTIDDDLAEALFNIHDAKKLQAATKLLKHGNKVPRVLQTLAGALRADVAFTGLDVWMFFKQRKEAELLSKINELAGKSRMSQARTQLAIGLSSVVVEGLLIWGFGCASGGPIGLIIGLGVGALTTAASFGVDTLYYNVRDFYEQREVQFLKQTRAQLKEAILQLINNKKVGDKSIHEQITSKITPRLRPGGDVKEKTLDDACTSMIFLEELEDDGEFANNPYLLEYVRSYKSKEDFISDKIKEIRTQKNEGELNEDRESIAQKYKEEFEQIWKKMRERIEIRKQYIKEEFKKPDIIESLNKGTGIRDLTLLFTRSRVFADLNKLSKRDDSVSFNENVENYKKDLFSEFQSDKIEKFESLKQNNPSLFEDIITTVTLDSFIYHGDEEGINTDDNYVQNVKIVVAYKNRLKFTESVEDKTHRRMKSIYNAQFIENVLKSDFDLDNAKCKTIDTGTLISGIMAGNNERYGDTDISDDAFQNILYRLARELYGYDGRNNRLDLIYFFNEGLADTHGIYYSNEWKSNSDNAIDGKLNMINFDTLYKKDVEQYVNEFMNNFIINNITYVGIGGYNYSSSTTQKESIDTPNESIDDNLNKEFRSTIKKIVYEELTAHTVENQTEVKEKIYDFVKRCGNGEEYLELPGYLVLDAKKAGLGDIARQYFRYKDGKIEICSMPSELNQKSIIDDCEKSIITPARTSYTEEERYYIDRIDNACQKLENILTDDIGLPKDLHDVIIIKEKEWIKLKENLLLYDGKIAKDLMVNKYVEFAEYFENLYRGILIAISGFRISNDISNVNYFNRAMSYGNQNIFDEEGNLLEVKEENYNIRNELAKQQEFRKFYNEQINKLKIGDKTIKGLWKSEDKKEKDLAYCASNIIYVTVMEQALIDDQGQIHTGNDMYYNCNSYGGGGYSIKYIESRYKSSSGSNTKGAKIDQDKINKVSEIIENKIRKMKIAPDISEERVNELRTSQVIQKISNGEKECTDTIPQLQAKIEKIGEDINRKGKRGDIKYDTEKSVIRSRGKEVKVELLTENNIKLKGLDLELTLQDGIWLANFKNWIKNKYPDKKITFERSYINRSLSFGKTFHVDDTMLITRGDLENLCPICNNDEIVEKITEWLNQNM